MVKDCNHVLATELYVLYSSKLKIKTYTYLKKKKNKFQLSTVFRTLFYKDGHLSTSGSDTGGVDIVLNFRGHFFTSRFLSNFLDF